MDTFSKVQINKNFLLNFTRGYLETHTALTQYACSVDFANGKFVGDFFCFSWNGVVQKRLRSLGFMEKRFSSDYRLGLQSTLKKSKLAKNYDLSLFGLALARFKGLANSFYSLYVCRGLRRYLINLLWQTRLALDSTVVEMEKSARVLDFIGIGEKKRDPLEEELERTEKQLRVGHIKSYLPIAGSTVLRGLNARILRSYSFLREELWEKRKRLKNEEQLFQSSSDTKLLRQRFWSVPAQPFLVHSLGNCRRFGRVISFFCRLHYPSRFTSKQKKPKVFSLYGFRRRILRLRPYRRRWRGFERFFNRLYTVLYLKRRFFKLRQRVDQQKYKPKFTYLAGIVRCVKRKLVKKKAFLKAYRCAFSFLKLRGSALRSDSFKVSKRFFKTLVDGVVLRNSLHFLNKILTRKNFYFGQITGVSSWKLRIRCPHRRRYWVAGRRKPVVLETLCQRQCNRVFSLSTGVQRLKKLTRLVYLGAYRRSILKRLKLYGFSMKRCWAVFSNVDQKRVEQRFSLPHVVFFVEQLREKLVRKDRMWWFFMRFVSAVGRFGWTQSIFLPKKIDNQLQLEKLHDKLIKKVSCFTVQPNGGGLLFLKRLQARGRDQVVEVPFRWWGACVRDFSDRFVRFNNSRRFLNHCWTKEPQLSHKLIYSFAPVSYAKDLTLCKELAMVKKSYFGCKHAWVNMRFASSWRLWSGKLSAKRLSYYYYGRWQSMCHFLQNRDMNSVERPVRSIWSGLRFVTARMGRLQKVRSLVYFNRYPYRTFLKLLQVGNDAKALRKIFLSEDCPLVLRRLVLLGSLLKGAKVDRLRRLLLSGPLTQNRFVKLYRLWTLSRCFVSAGLAAIDEPKEEIIFKKAELDNLRHVFKRWVVLNKRLPYLSFNHLISKHFSSSKMFLQKLSSKNFKELAGLDMYTLLGVVDSDEKKDKEAMQEVLPWAAAKRPVFNCPALGSCAWQFNSKIWGWRLYRNLCFEVGQRNYLYRQVWRFIGARGMPRIFQDERKLFFSVFNSLRHPELGVLRGKVAQLLPRGYFYLTRPNKKAYQRFLDTQLEIGWVRLSSINKIVLRGALPWLLDLAIDSKAVGFYSGGVIQDLDFYRHVWSQFTYYQSLLKANPFFWLKNRLLASKPVGHTFLGGLGQIVITNRRQAVFSAVIDKTKQTLFTFSSGMRGSAKLSRAAKRKQWLARKHAKAIQRKSLTFTLAIERKRKRKRLPLKPKKNRLVFYQSFQRQVMALMWFLLFHKQGTVPRFEQKKTEVVLDVSEVLPQHKRKPVVWHRYPFVETRNRELEKLKDKLDFVKKFNLKMPKISPFAIVVRGGVVYSRIIRYMLKNICRVLRGVAGLWQLRRFEELLKK